MQKPLSEEQIASTRRSAYVLLGMALLIFVLEARTSQHFSSSPHDALAAEFHWRTGGVAPGHPGAPDSRSAARGGDSSALPSAIGAATPGVPPLPQWPYRVAARVSLPPTESTGLLPAQLSGGGRDELVIVKGGLVTAYTCQEPTFRRVARLRFKSDVFNWTVGDLDRDGKDELYVVSKTNSILTIRLINGRLLVTNSAHLVGVSTICGMTVSDVRRRGTSELVIAVDTSERFDANLEDVKVYVPNSFVFYRRVNNRWVRTWEQDCNLGNETIEDLDGGYSFLPSPDLMMSYADPGAPIRYELWQWNGKRLRRRWHFTADEQSPIGAQDWVGATAGLTSAARVIVSKTTYQLSKPNEVYTVQERGELLQWDGKTTPVPIFRLRGLPVAVGHFCGKARPAILVEEVSELEPSGKYLLLEPAGGRSTLGGTTLPRS
jgi:hypothetical protein